jgi:hypothetical protein
VLIFGQEKLRKSVHFGLQDDHLRYLIIFSSSVFRNFYHNLGFFEFFKMGSIMATANLVIFYFLQYEASSLRKNDQPSE